MSFTGSISRIASVAGVSIQSSIVRTASGAEGVDQSLPAAKTGTLTTRTGDADGVITATAGHGITTGIFLQLFWEVGGVKGCRYHVATVVAGDAITISLGAGDVLPADETPLTLSAEVTINCADLDGDTLQMIVACCDKVAHIAFRETGVGGTVILAKHLTAGEDFSWADDTGVANPLTGNAFTQITAGCGDSASVGALKIGMIYDT